MLQTYLSPARFLAGGYGIDTEGLTVAQLRNKLVQATTMANRYCNAPKVPQAFDFRGGTMTDELHQFRVPNSLAYGPGVRRVFVNALPLRTVTALRLDVGLTTYIDINVATQVYVNTQEGYAEIVAITPNVVGYFPPWPIGLYRPIARISYTYGRTFEVVGDELEAESPTLFMASHGNWSETIAPTVYVDGVEISPNDYTVNTDDGRVLFDTTAQPAIGTIVTADYTYILDDAIASGVGEIATSLLAQRNMAQRGMIGLQSLRVAEVALTQLSPSQMSTKNGVTIPIAAAQYLDGFVMGTVA